MMVGSDTILELRNIFHSGQVEPSSWLQRLFGTTETGLILKDISLEVKAGEVLAVLGSKGSGKRALLDVISRRAHGPTRGHILFNGAPLTLSVFQKSCAYVTHRTDLIPSLTCQQSLYYAANLASAENCSKFTCSSKVRQMLVDLALNQVGQHSVSSLDVSEFRRLAIGVQLIKEPVVLLLDEPTVGLDPLSTYLIISMLSSYARRRGRCVVVTMEKPRSDVFPFLDRAAFLCLGDILYAGPTRLMLDYFTSIGFPCPRMENPLMYYLCLSTVDRRSRERFLESNSQIVELVEKFKCEGGAAYIGSGGGPPRPPLSPPPRPPSFISTSFTLYKRMFAATVNITPFGIYHLLLRLALFPSYCFIIFLVYLYSNNWSHMETNRYGLLLYSLMGAYMMPAITTAYTFCSFRTRYYQEAQEGLYSGPLFLLCYFLFSLPFTLLTVAAGSRILFQSADIPEGDYLTFASVLLGCYLLSEYQTLALMMVIRSSFTSLLASLYVTVIFVTLSSGVLRSYTGLPEWLLFTSYGSQVHYASAALSRCLLGEPLNNCTLTSGGCRYTDNSIHFAHRPTPNTIDLNLTLSLAFPAIFAIADLLLYIMPLPSFVKAKFRD